jgi:tetratricopeptide (TPR) repeat protein
MRLRVFTWSLVGAFVGFLLGVFLSSQDRGGPGTILLATLAGWAGSYFFPVIIMRLAGKAGGSLYAPSGRTTPPKREHSLAESLAVRGQYEEAVEVFASAIDEDPHDSGPYLRIARIKRDELGDFDAAAHWFRRALEESQIHAGLEMLARKELVELYMVHMSQAAKAAPILARIAAENPQTEEGEWAATELARVKEVIAQELGDR